MANPESSLPLCRSSVIAAHELIKPYIHYTSVLTNSTITTLASTPQSVEALNGTEWEGCTPARPKLRIWFKCENLQLIGAFKVRGAFYALQRLMAVEGWESGGGREKGVVTHSSGNHAQALALAARTMGVPATIVMPRISTPSKIAATKGYGACVVFSGSTSTEREAVVADIVKKTGAALIPPYDHPDIMLGQGTLGLEFQDQVEQMLASRSSLPADTSQFPSMPKCSFTAGVSETAQKPDGREEKKGEHGPRKGLDAVIASCGGGGMLSGLALSCAGTGIRVFGAEPSFEGGDDCRRGLAAGRRITTVATLTIADGLRTPVGAWPWRVISDPAMVRGVYAVTDGQIKAALRLVLERVKLVVEPSAVVGLAVGLFNEDFRRLVEMEAGAEGWDLGVVFSGGNVSIEALGKMFDGGGEGAEA